MPTDVNVVLVHGAWADGSCWSHVIPLLQQAGHRVVAVQLPLTSLADDIARTRQTLATVQGPIVLVGHSYGCAVVTGAGTNSPNVQSLVFVAGFALDEGESLGDIIASYPPLPSANYVKPDAQGFLWIEAEAFPENFMQDVDSSEARVLAAVQNPIAGRSFGDKSGPPAWKSLPSWYQVSEEDRMIHPDAERMMALRAQATTISLPGASHASLVSHPREIAALILEAAETTEQRQGM
jgi:pimeloyl-ACP methyl ester carboxylesterase